MGQDFRDEQERMRERASAATARAGQAFLRLLQIAERSDTGQARRIAHFIASAYNSSAFPFDLYELRAVDEAISDDILACLDGLRWAVADLHTLVPDGDQRVRRVIDSWGLQWPPEK